MVRVLGNQDLCGIHNKENSMNDWLKKEEFNEFKENDFYHLVRKVDMLKGEMKVLIPISVTILGVVLAILLT